MRGVIPIRSTARNARRALLAVSVAAAALTTAAAHGQAQPGTPAPAQTIAPTVPGPTLPTLDKPAPTPAIKPITPAPSATTPTIVLPQPRPSRTAAPASQRTPRPATAAPAPRAQPQVPLVPESPAAAAPTPVPPASSTPEASPAPEPSTTPPLAPASAEPSATPPLAPAEADNGTAWWPWAAGIAVLALAGAGLWRRRRRSAPVNTLPEPAPAPVRPTPPPPPPPMPKPAPQPAPALAPTPAGALDIALQADRLSATLVNATLSCRLVLTNHTPHALVDLAVSGDMTSAHASRPMDEQLGLAGPELPPLRTIDRLEPGESVTIAAEMRLPLSAVLAIRAGQAQLFVPIVRASVWATRADDGSAVHAHGAFLVGQPPAASDPAARLAPFRLDQGPRVFDVLDQKAMPLPAL